MPGVLEFTDFFSPNVGGVETHLTDLTEALSTRGWKVYVLSYLPLTTRASWASHEKVGNIEIWRLWWFGRGWFHVLGKYPFLQFLYLVPRLFVGALWWLLMHHRKVGVIHAHGLAPAFCARLLGPLFRKRLVMSSHAFYGLVADTWLSRAVSWILNGFDAVITMSAQSGEEFRRAGVEQGKLGRFRYWVDTDRFVPLDQASCRRELGIESGKFVCLFVGRLLRMKGPETLLRAARDTKFSGVQFVFVGEGPLEEVVQIASREQHNVLFLGSVPNHDLPKYYSAADLLCAVPTYQEGFPRVVLESLACGTPILGANCQGIREATDDSVAWLIEPTYDTFAEALSGLIRTPSTASHRRFACRRFAEERYSPVNVALVEQALAPNRRDGH